MHTDNTFIVHHGYMGDVNTIACVLFQCVQNSLRHSEKKVFLYTELNLEKMFTLKYQYLVGRVVDNGFFLQI